MSSKNCSGTDCTKLWALPPVFFHLSISSVPLFLSLQFPLPKPFISPDPDPELVSPFPFSCCFFFPFLPICTTSTSMISSTTFLPACCLPTLYPGAITILDPVHFNPASRQHEFQLSCGFLFYIPRMIPPFQPNKDPFLLPSVLFCCLLLAPLEFSVDGASLTLSTTLLCCPPHTISLTSRFCFHCCC